MSFETDVILKSSIILLFATGLTALLRRASASARFAIWAMGLGAALLLPVASIVLPDVDVPVLPPAKVEFLSPPRAATTEGSSDIVKPRVSPASNSAKTGITSGNSVSRETPAPASTPPPVSVRAWLMLAWSVGVLVVFVRSLLGISDVRNLKRRSRPVADGRWQELLFGFRRELSISAPVELRMGGEANPPMTWGIFRHTILFPTAAADWTMHRMRLVVAHELAHVKRRDGLLQILIQLACALYWFNPLVWLAAYQMRIERERASDDQVLNLGLDAEDYAAHLLDIARDVVSGWTFAAVGVIHPSQLETRLRAILDPARNRRKLSAYSTFVLVGFATLLTSIVAAARLTALPLTPLLLTPATTLPQPIQPALLVKVPEMPRVGVPKEALIEFVRIVPGEFTMGCSGSQVCPENERPAHRVRITRDLELGKYEVTQAQWEFVMGRNPSYFKGTDLPVQNVNWEDIQEFLAKLNSKNDGYRYRLPTEAEWEYAARAGGSTLSDGPLDSIAWFGNNSGHLPLDAEALRREDPRSYTRQLIDNGNQARPVGQKQPNRWGLYDMLGNVEEWVADWYDSQYYRASPVGDPEGPSSEIMDARGRPYQRVIRGSSWFWDARFQRVTTRHTTEQSSSRRSDLGFRAAREPLLVRASQASTFALVIVLDKSGSMKPNMRLAREASRVSLRMIRAGERFGLLSFNYDSEWSVPLQQINPGLSIPDIVSGGETDMFKALREAYSKLSEVQSTTKHIFLLSDGRTLPGEYLSLLDQLNQNNVTVSTVAFGSGADRPLLARIAELGQGRAYFADDASKLPEIFAREIKIAQNN